MFAQSRWRPSLELYIEVHCVRIAWSMSLPQSLTPELICKQRVSPTKTTKAFLSPLWQLKCPMSLLVDIFQGLSSLNRQKLLSQNKMPQSKISLVKNIKEFIFCFHFSDVYTPNALTLTYILYLLWWISCENSIFVSYVESDLPHFLKIFAITQ